ncbi:hypothetical protein DMB95_03400 [Campylobacter sp. MIT 12-8780]|uniref:acyltransferase n=1 Tax=unclassified Campylobacter TaxID=2593542 RepID=UPI00115E4DCA|nr:MULTISPECIES: hypothetical protein [unclassified Campylobacter]NDJ26889.1 hypothetical protein [Campylobacter sp. MIT 19-121]TQR41967.1 hypothetical protein DMB95_03400 [Campylobacter sp. MIT 12-8780]
MIPFQKDERNNIIYGDLSKQKNLKFEFKGRDNILFFAAESVNVNAIFYGDNALLFIADNIHINGRFVLHSHGLCYIGKNSTSNGADFRVYEGKNIILGDDVMFSWGIWLSTCDHHLIFNSKTYARNNFSKSIYIGDHVWCGQESAILKGCVVASGSVLGAKSVNSGKKFSNAIYAGNPSQCIKNEVFWSRLDPCVGNWGKVQTKQHKTMQTEDFKFTFQKEKFLNPALIEKELESMDTALQKLEFVYDYIYNNTEKNRFALFEDSDSSECKLYKDEGKTAFKDLKFMDSKELQKLEIFKPKGAKERIQNTLSYKLGLAMIQNSKNTSGIISLPFTLLKIQNKHKKAQKLYQEQIKINPNLKLPPLQIYKDYEEALKAKEHLSYKLGEALIQAHKNILKGGYVKFFFELKRIKNSYKNTHK